MPTSLSFMPISLSSLFLAIFGLLGYFLAATSHNPWQIQMMNHLAKNFILDVWLPCSFFAISHNCSFGRNVKFCQNVVTNFVPKPKIGFSAKMLNIVCVSYVQTNVCDRLKTPINGFRALLERYKKVKNWYKTKQKNCVCVTCVSESLCESESL